MLASVGPVSFEILPMNLTGWSATEETSFAEKSVLGVRPPLEWVGEGPASWSLTVKLFPEKFGGLGDLDVLRAVRASGLPQFFMLGSGTPLGWVVIDKLGVKHTYLGQGGVGKVVEVDISLKASGGPSNGSFFSILTGAEIGINIARSLNFGGAALSDAARGGVLT